MSKNDMVMVPREWVDNTIGAGPGEPVCRSDIDMLKAALASEQCRGEPVALPARNKERHFDKLTSFEREVYAAGRAAGRNDCLDEIAKLGPLFTSDDSGEVGRLRETLELVREQRDNELRTNSSLERERDTLRAQLAERDALLRKVRAYVVSQERITAEIDNALSASAEPTPREKQALEEEKKLGIERFPVEPSEPVEIDERTRLEAYCTRVGLPLDQLPSGEYLIPATRFVSQGWQARAALERKPS